MSVKTLRDRIQQEVVGALSKQIFLVEGSDDQEAFRILLERFVPGWEQRWGIAVAGNKRQLLGLLQSEPNWLGVVDRDEWDQAAIGRYTADRPNLLVLPRFCLENYLIDPLELWQAVPPARQSSLPGGQAALVTAIMAELPRYLRHGALWKVVTPLWSGLRALGFKEALASEASLATAESDIEIQRILGDWDALLDPSRIFADFQSQLDIAQSAPAAEQLAQWVHGKVFWKNVVNPAMNAGLGQMAERERRIKILRKLPCPLDLQPILNRCRSV